ncbi:MAG TPA: sigma-70 family RNA polymerase sigma factor, partial [Longimicrobiales bacterium]|nr:sigma-70 family RNA polymerase sigma factor [Longimicrobiales bacterium]
FLRLYRRGSLPDRPEAWLVTVSLNLFRNDRATRSRRRRRLDRMRAVAAHSDPPPAPIDAVAAGELRARARRALDRLEPRERQLLVLRAEGYAYRDIAEALELHEASVGTLLARARRAFADAWEGDARAP